MSGVSEAAAKLEYPYTRTCFFRKLLTWKKAPRQGGGGWGEGSSAEYLDQAPALIRGGTGEKDSNFLPLEKERPRRDGSGLLRCC